MKYRIVKCFVENGRCVETIKCDDIYSTREEAEAAVEEYEANAEEERDFFCEIEEECEKFYAVQYGDCFDWDDGSEDYEAALAMANDLVNDENYNGLEIRIATIDVDNSFCLAEEIIREGERG